MPVQPAQLHHSRSWGVSHTVELTEGKTSACSGFVQLNMQYVSSSSALWLSSVMYTTPDMLLVPAGYQPTQTTSKNNPVGLTAWFAVEAAPMCIRAKLAGKRNPSAKP
jgi:hypothetical protein